MVVGLFNKGYFVILKIMDTLKLKIGSHCKEYADSYDVARNDSSRNDEASAA